MRRNTTDDCLSSLVVAQLALDDICNISFGRKGKSRDNVPLSDEEIAFKLFEEEITAVSQNLSRALSLQQAIDSDQDVLAMLATLEQGAVDDQRYAQALSNGQILPERSDAQKTLEDPKYENIVISLLPKTGSGPSQVDCVICGDRVRTSTTFRAPCSHYYSCLGDESLFPLRCCQQSLPMRNVLQMLTDVLRVQFEAKSREFETLAHHRVYCSNPRCSKFLGSSETSPGMDMRCSRCSFSTCVLCKQSSHSRETCSENTALNELKALAEKCSCPQWDEVRLLDTAAQRVEREVGMEVRAAEPVAFQRLVRQRATELRYRHDCDPHRWRHYQGAGTCEECGHYLPLFLKGCRDCHIMVCVRCMRNRL
ncbi:hypothetical protein BDP27DRAFT_1490655 [Rhodocollybia butyracea]|uniref:IBR domain-containing protein n=1 Tax=Rhodocollybia butyracea TaxID=206335 RepID=A0A9P5Q2A2_9AGAR|nr:hypothetical protein BDP27DRAFT_1490655 [Rhodocollybia butyracea]